MQNSNTNNGEKTMCNNKTENLLNEWVKSNNEPQNKTEKLLNEWIESKSPQNKTKELLNEWVEK